MAVVISRKSPTSSVLGGSPHRIGRNLENYGQSSAKKKTWLTRNDGDKSSVWGTVHIAESQSHQAWLKKMLEVKKDKDAAAHHDVWRRRQLEKLDSPGHNVWTDNQRYSGERIKGTSNDHDYWLKDHEMPMDLMDGGMHLEIAAAEYCQAIWRGRAQRKVLKMQVIKGLKAWQTASRARKAKASKEAAAPPANPSVAPPAPESNVPPPDSSAAHNQTENAQARPERGIAPPETSRPDAPAVPARVMEVTIVPQHARSRNALRAVAQWDLDVDMELTV